MFGKVYQAIKDFFAAPPIRTQFEEMVLQEEVEKKNAVPPAVADVVPSHGSHAEAKAEVSKKEAPETVTILAEPVHGKHSKPVDSQITDAVTAKPKKVRKAKDAESVSAASEAPAKKPRAPRKKKVD